MQRRPGSAAALLRRSGRSSPAPIRTSGEWDGVVDFDLATRDPARPTMLLPAYDSGDHLHPNDLGYQAMADAVNLTLLAPAYRR